MINQIVSRDTFQTVSKYTGTVSSQWICIIKAFLHDSGVTNLPPLSDFGIADNDWDSTQKPVPVEGVRQLHHWAVNQTQNVLFPLELGLRLQPLDLKNLGILLWSAATPRHRIEKLCEYQSLLSTSTRVVCIESEKKVSLLMFESDPHDTEVKMSDLGMMSLVGTVISILKWEQKKLLSFTLDLPFKQPVWGVLLQERLGAKINFSAKHYRIELLPEELDMPFTSTNHNLSMAVEPLVRDQLLIIEQHNIVHTISQTLFKLSPFSPPTIGKIAEAHNISTRTLQRKLLEAGLTYRQLINKTRYEKAIALMASHNCSLTSIAYELGFSDLSSFSRAFKSWDGVSPSKYLATRQE